LLSWGAFIWSVPCRKNPSIAAAFADRAFASRQRLVRVFAVPRHSTGGFKTLDALPGAAAHGQAARSQWKCLRMENGTLAIGFMMEVASTSVNAIEFTGDIVIKCQHRSLACPVIPHLN
jgi:hypothetical protein